GAEHADLAVRPRLMTDPLLNVEAVLRLVDVRLPLALRRAQSARVDRDDGIAARRLRGGATTGAGLSVRRDREQSGKRTLARWQIKVCAKRCAVAHRDRDVGLCWGGGWCAALRPGGSRNGNQQRQRLTE